MKGSVLLLTQLGLYSGSLHAQLTYLTLRESESLVERIPEVVAAEKKGECPSLSPNYDTSEELGFQVRSTCGDTGGMLINNYTVNRRTGEVTLCGDNPERVLDAEGKAFATQLISQARKRILSAGEAQCLAGEASRSLPHWSEADAVVSVKAFGQSNTSFSKMNALRGALYFIASRSSNTRPTESGRILRVDLRNAVVRDEATGSNMMSAGLGALNAKMMELREPLWLSDEDALSIAALIPQLTRSILDGCKVQTGGPPQSSTRTHVWVSCGEKGVQGTIVAIDIRTGEATDLHTGESLHSPEAKQLARERLTQI